MQNMIKNTHINFEVHVSQRVEACTMKFHQGENKRKLFAKKFLEKVTYLSLYLNKERNQTNLYTGKSILVLAFL